MDFENEIVCVGHVKPLFSLTDSPLLLLSEEDLGVANSWVFGDEFPDLKKHGYTLSEYSALFALYRKLSEKGKVPDRLILTQYRKFVANRSIGQASVNMTYVNVVAEQGLSLSRKDLEPLNANLMVSRPHDMGMRVLDQYSKVHVLRDLMAFVCDAIGRGVISNAEAKDMIDSRFIIAAPTLGAYDGKAFMEIFSALEQAASYFLAKSYQPREGYQRRVLGFCLERLHSYLLLKRLGFPYLQAANFGWQVVISDTPHVQTTH